MGRTWGADLSPFSSAPVLPEMIRSATPFPLVSLFFMFIGFILSNIGHVRPHRTILAFVSGIFFILSGEFCWARFSLDSPPFLVISSTVSQFWGFTCHAGAASPASTPAYFSLSSSSVLPGLSLVVGLVLYISSINDEMLNRTKDSETFFNYKYGWSFAFSAISFLLTEVLAALRHPCNECCLFSATGHWRGH